MFADVGLSTRIDISAPDPNSPRTMPDDGYPAVIEDQRHLYLMLTQGRVPVETVEQVEALEAGWLAGECPPHPQPPKDWPALVARPDPEGRTVTPFINASRWLGECPACRTASAVWDRRPVMVCLGRGCGLRFKVAWQSPQERAKVIRLIADWPANHRSWDAHKGETYDELVYDHARNMGDVVLRNGLILASGLPLPDELTSVADHFEKLRTARLKAFRAER